MKQYSTREAAQKLGLDFRTMQRRIADGRIPVPPVQSLGGVQFRIWTDQDIEHVRQILPKIANGRKTRYKKQSAVSDQQSVKTQKKTQAKVPAPQKKK